MLGILKVKMSLEYPTFETAFKSGLGFTMSLKYIVAYAQLIGCSRYLCILLLGSNDGWD